MLSCRTKQNPNPLPTEVRACIEVDIAQTREFQGTFIGFSGFADGKDHAAIRLGPDRPGEPPLVRLHSECLTGDVFGSMRCDCGPQFDEAIEKISEVGGYLLNLRQERRGIGLVKKLQSYDLQSKGYDTYEANEKLSLAPDLRDYSVAVQMLRALGVEQIRLLTHNPSKVSGLEANGIQVSERVPTSTFVNPHNRDYLLAKQQKGRHQFDLNIQRERK